MTTSMGKTFEPKRTDKIREREKIGNNGVKKIERDHEKAETKRKLREYQSNWQDLEDGD